MENESVARGQLKLREHKIAAVGNTAKCLVSHHSRIFLQGIVEDCYAFAYAY